MAYFHETAFTMEKIKNWVQAIMAAISICGVMFIFFCIFTPDMMRPVFEVKKERRTDPYLSYFLVCDPDNGCQQKTWEEVDHVSLIEYQQEQQRLTTRDESFNANWKKVLDEWEDLEGEDNQELTETDPNAELAGVIVYCGSVEETFKLQHQQEKHAL